MATCQSAGLTRDVHGVRHDIAGARLRRHGKTAFTPLRISSKINLLNLNFNLHARRAAQSATRSPLTCHRFLDVACRSTSAASASGLSIRTQRRARSTLIGEPVGLLRVAKSLSPAVVSRVARTVGKIVGKVLLVAKAVVRCHGGRAGAVATQRESAAAALLFHTPGKGLGAK